MTAPNELSIKRGARLLLDAYGALPEQVRALRVDLASLETHYASQGATRGTITIHYSYLDATPPPEPEPLPPRCVDGVRLCPRNSATRDLLGCKTTGCAL